MKFKLMVLLLIIANNLTAQSKKENLDAYFSSLFKNGQFNGNVLIAQEGQILYERSFGLADLSTRRKITNESSFPIASITKTFTATAILQLKQQGKLELEDKVSKFLPEFPYPKVTIKQLLSHTAGLPIYDSLFYSFIPKHPDTVFTNKDLIPAFLSSKAPLIFKSGEDFSYNNVNYNILALVIEKLSGLSYGAYLNEYIFKPLGMKNTSLSNFFSREDKNLSKRYNYKYPYSENLQLVDTAAEFQIINSFNFQGHGDLISTTHDLSYGEVLMKYGKKKEAFKMCQKSVDLNPNNENGREVLAAISVINVKFKSAGVTLEGTIYKPERFEAALVLVHGSGQEKRMNDVASRLAKNGIAVLTYDKRGVGKSGGVYAGPEVGTNNVDAANLNLLALDASAAANELSKNLKAKRVPLGLMGFSQAAWVIPLAAKKNLKVEFMALFSAPVATTLEQLRFQFYTNGNSKFWETHTEAEAREHISNDPDKYQFAVTDPLASLNSLSIPGLWLYGGKDIQAPVGISIERLGLLKVKGKQYGYQLFPQLGHNIGSSKSKEPMEFAIQWIKIRGKKVNR